MKQSDFWIDCVVDSQEDVGGATEYQELGRGKETTRDEEVWQKSSTTETSRTARSEESRFGQSQ